MDQQAVFEELYGPKDPLKSRFQDLVAKSGTNLFQSKTKLKKNGPGYCVFCKNNKESVQDYTSHVVKDNDGLVICPVLHNYVCPICKATGFFAHTVKHCPRNEENLKKQRALAKEWAKLAGSSEQKPEESPPTRSRRSSSGCSSMASEVDDPLDEVKSLVTNPEVFKHNVIMLLTLQQLLVNE